MSGILSIRKYRPDSFRIVEINRHIREPLSDMVAETSSSTTFSLSDVVRDNCAPVHVRTKPRCSFSRARTAVYEYAVCNDWQFFATFTPGCDLHYNDLDAFMRDVSRWVRNMRRVEGFEGFKYIIVPEKFDSSDGWHLHGLICGVPHWAVGPFDVHSAKNPRQRMKMEALNADGYMDFPSYSSRFGFVTVSPITDIDKSVGYMCQYMMKSFSDSVMSAGASLYYPCKGLKRAERVFYGECELSRSLSSVFNMFGDLPEQWVDKYRNTYYSLQSFSNDFCVGGSLRGFVVEMENNIPVIKVYTPDFEEEITIYDVLDLREVSSDFFRKPSLDSSLSSSAPLEPVQIALSDIL